MSDNTVTDEKRKAYGELIEMIQDAGYRVVNEQYVSPDHDPEFDAYLSLIPPEFETLDVDDGTGDEIDRPKFYHSRISVGMADDLSDKSY